MMAGCASPMTAVRDDNTRLSHQVTELRGERRNQDRKVRDLQRQLDLMKAKSSPQGSADGAMPNLPVEVVGPAGAASPSPSPSPSDDPGDARVVGIAEDGTEIVYEGDAAAGRVATLEDVSPAPAAQPMRRFEPTRATVAARRSPAPERVHERAPDRGGDAGNEYRLAVELVKGGSYEQSIEALRAFLVAHPRHDYADNAQYWLGEAFYGKQDYPHALAEFRTVIETYPRGNKVPDALLKVGFCYQAMGQGPKARAVLEQVVNLYPKTEPAAIAAKRLEAS